MTFREEVIGDARLFLGDCREVLPTLGKVDAVVTDPPFEKEAHTPIRRTQRSIRTGVHDALDFEAITDDLRLMLPTWAFRNCSGWLLAFCQVEAVSIWRDAMEDAGLKYKRGMAWVKPDSSPQFNGQGPAQGYECIASGWCGAGYSKWNAGGKRGVYIHNTNQPGRHGVHPTEKPVSLLSEIIGDFTEVGSLVLDPFMGSGTTGVACAKLGRRFIGIELDEAYFNVACRRIEKAYAQPDLFIAPPAPKAEQLTFLEAAE
jgi:site-specific DNA-methyltransferase (adenine-specific)